MKAVIQDRYGPAELLRVGQVPRPAPNADEVLVRVHSSSVTRSDAGLRGLEYPITRPLTGMRRPKNRIAGTEFAGEVVEVGSSVTDFRVGDEVFGIERGSNAEFIAVGQRAVIAHKPSALTCEQAAAIPDGALLALTTLPKDIAPGASVLIYGSAGSIGTAAVQLFANHLAANVTAVCDTKDVDLVRSLGASVVIDRFAEDFTKNGETYDVIYDAVGKHSFRRCRRSLKPGGTYITLDLGFLYHAPLVALITRFAGNKRARVGIGRYRRNGLLRIKALIEAGKYRPVIDRTYSLDDVVEATRYVETGEKSGNVVLRVSVSNEGMPDSTARVVIPANG